MAESVFEPYSPEYISYDLKHYVIQDLKINIYEGCFSKETQIVSSTIGNTLLKRIISVYGL